MDDNMLAVLKAAVLDSFPKTAPDLHQPYTSPPSLQWPMPAR